MFENKRLDKIENDIRILKMESDCHHMLFYGSKHNGLLSEVVELKQKVENLISETLPELKPCPICGKEPKVSKEKVDSSFGGYRTVQKIECNCDPDHTVAARGGNYEQALLNWNGRSNDCIL